MPPQTGNTFGNIRQMLPPGFRSIVPFGRSVIGNAQQQMSGDGQSQMPAGFDARTAAQRLLAAGYNGPGAGFLQIITRGGEPGFNFRSLLNHPQYGPIVQQLWNQATPPPQGQPQGQGMGDSLRGWGDPFMMALRNMFGQQVGGWFGGGQTPPAAGGGAQQGYQLPAKTGDVSAVAGQVGQRMGITGANPGLTQVGQLLTGREITDPGALRGLGDTYKASATPGSIGERDAIRRQIRQRLGVAGNVRGIGAQQLANMMTGREAKTQNLGRLQHWDNPAEMPRQGAAPNATPQQPRQPRPQQPPRPGVGQSPMDRVTNFFGTRPPLQRPTPRPRRPANGDDGGGSGGI